MQCMPFTILNTQKLRKLVTSAADKDMAELELSHIAYEISVVQSLDEP